MGTNFIPGREADLVTFANNFSSLLTATPTLFGCTAAQATTMAGLNTAWLSAYNTAKNSLTRSPANIITKDQAKKALIAEIRLLARIIQSYPLTTNAQRSQLGITVHSQPTPIGPPGVSPVLEVGTVTGWSVNTKLHGSASPSKRGKPPGVSGASVFSYVGAEPPADISAWKFEGNTGRTDFVVVFPSTVAPGAKVWLTAFWFNERKQSGPACPPVSTNVQGGTVSMAA